MYYSISSLLWCLLCFLSGLVNFAFSSIPLSAHVEQPHSSKGQLPFHAHHQAPLLLDETFDKQVQQLLEEFHVPGLAIAIVDNVNITSKVCLVREQYSRCLD